MTTLDPRLARVIRRSVIRDIRDYTLGALAIALWGTLFWCAFVIVGG